MRKILCFLTCFLAMVTAPAWAEEPLLHALHFEGNKAIADKDLAERLTLKIGQPYSEDRLIFSKGVLHSFYQDQGYWSVSISTRVATSRPNQVAVTFLIKEGPL